MRVVYVDILFFTNAIITFLLLKVTMKLADVYGGTLRMLLASALSGLCAVLTYFPKLSLLPSFLIKAAICLMICEVAFGKKLEGQRVRVSLVFCGISFGFAGCVTALIYVMAPTGKMSINNGVPYFDLSAAVLIAFCLVSYVLFSLVGGSGRLKAMKQISDVRCSVNGRQTSVKALCDTGNLLKDPVSGRKVILVSKEALKPLFSPFIGEVIQGLNKETLTQSFELLAGSGEGSFRLIPYTDASESGGMLIAFRPDKLFVNGTLEKGYMLGISLSEIETADGCRAIMGV